MQLFENILWAVNGVLALLAAALICSLLLFTFFQIRKRARHRLDLDRMDAALRDYLDAAPSARARDADFLLRKMTLDEWCEITRSTAGHWPVNKAETMRVLLRSSGLTESAFKKMNSRLSKWKRIDLLQFLAFVRAEGVLEALREQLKEGDDDERYFGAVGLAKLGTSEALLALFESLSSARYSGQKILSVLDKEAYVTTDAVLGVLKLPGEKPRYWALKLLSRLPAPPQPQAALELIESPSAELRAAACECAGNWKLKAALNVLKDRLKDEVWFVRLHALRGYARIGGRGVLPDVLAVLLGDRHESVKEAAKNILSGFVTGSFSLIVENFKQGDPETKRDLISFLIETNQVPYLLAAVADARHPEHKRALSLFGDIIRSGIYFGLKHALAPFAAADRDRILNEVRRLDPELAQRLAGVPERSHD